jgi:hypothetical protein
MPRSAPAPARTAALRRVVLAVVGAALLGAVAFASFHLFAGFGARS